MQIDIIDQIEKLPGIKKDWLLLYTALEDYVTPFSSYEWHETWWQHYSAGGSLFIIVGRDAGRVVGIAPLMRRRATMHGLSAQVICFLENNQSASCDFIVLPKFREQFLSAMIHMLESPAEKAGWDVLVLNKLSVCSENYLALLNLINRSSYRWREEQTLDGRYLVPEGSWEEYWASRSTRTRKSLRQVQNRMHKVGMVEVEQIRSLTRLEKVWEDICRVARDSWTGQIGESLASPANEAFFRELARTAAANGWLSVWTLRLDEKMLAVEFHLRDSGKEYAMCGHYLPEDSTLSPGAYLELEILKHVFSEEVRLKKYDMGDYYSYKRKWTDKSEPHQMVSVFNRRLYARLLCFCEMRAVPFLRRVIPQQVWQHQIFKLLGIKTAPYDIRQR